MVSEALGGLRLMLPPCGGHAPSAEGFQLVI
jgi:hypothetical protein